jgi:hypothetical protein
MVQNSSFHQFLNRKFEKKEWGERANSPSPGFIAIYVEVSLTSTLSLNFKEIKGK